MADLLIAARDLGIPVMGPEGLSLVWERGDVVDLFESPHLFRDMEVLPDFIQVRISNRTKAQITPYMAGWIKTYRVTLQGSDATHDQFKCEIHPNFISASGAGGIAKQQMKNALLTEFSGTQINASPSSLTMQTPVGAYTDTEILEFMRRKFTARVKFRQWYFNSAAVDSVIALGGKKVVTWSQVTNNIVNRLTE